MSSCRCSRSGCWTRRPDSGLTAGVRMP
jgi:hypothetical protein